MAAKFFTGLPLDGPDPECVGGDGELALAGAVASAVAAAGGRPLQAVGLTVTGTGHVRAKVDRHVGAAAPGRVPARHVPERGRWSPAPTASTSAASGRATPARRTSPACSAGARASGCSCSTPPRARSRPAAACSPAVDRPGTCSARRRSSATCSRCGSASVAARASPPAAGIAAVMAPIAFVVLVAIWFVITRVTTDGVGGLDRRRGRARPGRRGIEQRRWWEVLAVIGLAALVMARHVGNIRRLLARREHALTSS